MRPTLSFLEPDLIARVVEEARDLLRSLGMTIHNQEVLSLLGDHGAKVDRAKERAILSDEIMDRAIQSAPPSFELFDAVGNQTHAFSGRNVHFSVGTEATHILDSRTGRARKPTTRDFIRYAKVMGRMEHVASQSTAFSPADVPESISDSYPIFLSLLCCEKPVVTRAPTTAAFEVLKDLLLIIRGGEEKLKRKPLAVLSSCPASPIEWSHDTSQNILACARQGIPLEFFSAPSSGSPAPVTLVGTLIQHTAEILSGIAIGQLASPGTPMLYGGSPAVFDLRHQVTPMGTFVTMLMDFADAEIGRWLGFPTQGYASPTHTSLPEGRRFEAEAGAEVGPGLTLRALAGINNISGPGLLGFEGCLSLERLLLDNELCGTALQMLGSLAPRGDNPGPLLFRMLPPDGPPVAASQALGRLSPEITDAVADIEEVWHSRRVTADSPRLWERASREVERLVQQARPSRLDDGLKGHLVRRMEAEARRAGLSTLPSRDG